MKIARRRAVAGKKACVIRQEGVKIHKDFGRHVQWLVKDRFTKEHFIFMASLSIVR